MKTLVSFFVVFAVATLFATASSHAAHSGASAPLNPSEQKQLDDARAAARHLAQMKEPLAKFYTGYKTYEAERQKVPAERDKNAAEQFHKVILEYEAAERQAVLQKHPELKSLYLRWEAAKTEQHREQELKDGETLAESDSPNNPTMRPIEDVPGLPRVLLIGDSISIGYTPTVREQLKGRANIHRIPVNGSATIVGLQNIRAWLGDQHWDVIHFNFGLHDARYESLNATRVPRAEYAQNLRMMLSFLKATGAHLVFATTTPVPHDGVLALDRRYDSIAAYNQIAAQIMKQNGVAIDDLYSVALPVQEQVGRPGDLHFQHEGYVLLGKSVAKSIEGQLGSGESQR